MRHMDKTKKCAHCRTDKPVKQFYRTGQQWTSWCKECSREWSRRQAASGYFRALRARHTAARGGPKRPKPLTEIERLAADSHKNLLRRATRKGERINITRAWLEAAMGAFTKAHYYETAPAAPFKPSVDRIDSAKGCTKDNVQIVWLIENYAKNRFTDADVLRFCRLKLGVEPPR
jgi:transposase-like protein